MALRFAVNAWLNLKNSGQLMDPSYVFYGQDIDEDDDTDEDVPPPPEEEPPDYEMVIPPPPLLCQVQALEIPVLHPCPPTEPPPNYLDEYGRRIPAPPLPPLPPPDHEPHYGTIEEEEGKYKTTRFIGYLNKRSTHGCGRMKTTYCGTSAL